MDDIIDKLKFPAPDGTIVGINELLDLTKPRRKSAEVDGDEAAKVWAMTFRRPAARP